MTRLMQVVNTWLEDSDNDIELADYLFTGKKYLPCLYFCHLSLEKLLKGLVLEITKRPVPYTHSLTELIKLIDPNINNNSLIDNLEKINGFNISAKYKVERDEIYDKISRNETDEYFNMTKDIRIWIKNQYHTKSKKK